MIKEVDDDLLYYLPATQAPVWKILPTNYSVDGKGKAIMGAGLAKQYAETCVEAKYTLGTLIQCNPTVPRVLPLGVHINCWWWALPTKHRVEDNASAEMLRSGLWELVLYYTRQISKPVIVLPRLGCGCGGMKWRHAEPIIRSELAKVDEVYICHLSSYGTTQV